MSMVILENTLYVDTDQILYICPVDVNHDENGAEQVLRIHFEDGHEVDLLPAIEDRIDHYDGHRVSWLASDRVYGNNQEDFYLIHVPVEGTEVPERWLVRRSKIVAIHSQKGESYKAQLEILLEGGDSLECPTRVHYETALQRLLEKGSV